MGELLKLLGVSRTRVQQLVARPEFPNPVAVLMMGSVWDLERVQEWARSAGRVLNLEALASSPTVDATGHGDPQSKRVP